MKIFRLAVLAGACILGTAVAQDAETQIEHAMKIQVITDDADGNSTFNWTSNGADIDFQDMQVGESRSIIDDDGRSVLVTKSEEGLTFDVDGKSIFMPDIGAVESGSVSVLALDGSEDIDHEFDIAVAGAPYVMGAPVDGGTMIVTGEPLDAATQESIRAVLQSAGNMDEVTFVDRSNANRTVHVVRKQVEIKN